MALADKMLDILGEGTFGKVVEAFDRTKRCRLAIKIIKSVPKYRCDQTRTPPRPLYCRLAITWVSSPPNANASSI